MTSLEKRLVRGQVPRLLIRDASGVPGGGGALPTPAKVTKPLGSSSRTSGRTHRRPGPRRRRRDTSAGPPPWSRTSGRTHRPPSATPRSLPPAPHPPPPRFGGVEGGGGHAHRELRLGVVGRDFLQQALLVGDLCAGGPATADMC